MTALQTHIPDIHNHKEIVDIIMSDLEYPLEPAAPDKNYVTSYDPASNFMKATRRSIQDVAPGLGSDGGGPFRHGPTPATVRDRMVMPAWAMRRHQLANAPEYQPYPMGDVLRELPAKAPPPHGSGSQQIARRASMKLIQQNSVEPWWRHRHRAGQIE